MLLTVDLARLDLRTGDRLLDVGCGEGRHCFGALERGAHVVGLDLDAAALRRASGPLRAAAKAAGRSGAVLRGNAFALPFPAASFDRVICSEVMEHVHDVAAAAREIARVVRPGGTCAVTVPTAISERLYLRLGDDYFETPGGHIRIFRPRALAQVLTRVGLRPSGVGFAHGFHTAYWALRSIVGLPRADRNRWVRAYRNFLLLATQSRWLDAFERRVLNFVCPKSLVIYTRRDTVPSRA